MKHKVNFLEDNHHDPAVGSTGNDIFSAGVGSPVCNAWFIVGYDYRMLLCIEITEKLSDTSISE